MAVARDAARSATPLPNQALTCSVWAPLSVVPPATATRVPPRVVAAAPEHFSRPPCDTGVHSPAMARASLPSILSLRSVPLPSTDVRGPQPLVADVACVLSTNRETLPRSKEALAAAVPLHDCALVPTRLLSRPPGPRHSPTSVASSLLQGHVMCTHRIFL